MNRKLARFNTLTSGTQGAQAATKAFNNLNNSAAQANASLAKNSKGFSDTGKAGSRAGQDITASWTTMLRVVQTQILVRALNETIQFFSEAASAARDFELSVGRIASIASGPQGTIDALKTSVRELAVELGRPVDQVAGAAYEALQNDLGTIDETLNLVANSAQNLALITGGDLTDSVNTVSSVLKIFNIDIDDADRITDVLFRTIDAGRVTLDDLANSLGNVGPLAAQLSVSFEELSASIAAVTLQGVDSSRAQTQLRGVFNALLKPTRALNQAFVQIGVSSGKELIETSGGLIQALQELEKVAGGSEQQFAKFFGRIRGQLGALNVLNDNASNATRILTELGLSAGDAAEEAAKINELNARKFEVEMAKARDLMLDLGDSFAKVQTIALTAFNLLVDNAGVATKAIAALAAGLAFLAGAVIIAAIGSLVSTIGLIGIAVIGVASILSTFIPDFIGSFQTLDGKVKNIVQDLAREEAKISRDAEREAKDAQQAFETSLDQREKAAEEYIKSIDKLFDKETEALRQAEDVAVGTLKNTLNQFERGFEAVFDRIDDRIDGAQQNFDDATQDLNGAIQDLADFDFNQGNKNKSDAQIFERTFARAEQSLRDLQRKIRDASSPQELEGLTDEVKRLLNQTKDATGAADDLNGAFGSFKQRDAAELQRKALQAQVKLQKRKKGFAQDELEQAAANEAELNKQKSVFEEINDLLRERADLASNIDPKTGEFQTADQQAADQERIDQINEKLSNLTGQFSTAFFDKFGEAKNIAKLSKALTDGFDQAEYDFNRIREGIQAKLDEAPFQAALELVQQGTAPTGNPLVDQARQSAVDQAGASPSAQLQALAETNRELSDALGGIEQQRTTAINNFNAATRAQNEIIQAAGRDLTQPQIEALTPIADRIGEINRQLLDPNITKPQVDALGQELAGLKPQIDELAKLDLIPQPAANAFIQAVQLGISNVVQNRANVVNLDAKLKRGALEEFRNNVLETTKQLNQDPVEIPVESQGTEEVKQDAMSAAQTLDRTASSATQVSSELIQSAIPANQMAASISQSDISAQQLSVTTTSQVGSANSLAQAWANVAAQARAAAAASAAAGGAQNAYHGGKIAHFALGGRAFTRGQDRILASLAPGEIVLNQRASRNFTAEALAMNAGQRPQFREQGGPVTNIGDVNVNINSNDSGGIDGRQIGQDIRRELRRGTLRLS